MYRVMIVGIFFFFLEREGGRIDKERINFFRTLFYVHFLGLS